MIVSTDAEQMRAADRFDFLLDTIPVQHDLNPYLETLKFDGVHILVGLIEPIDPAVHAANLVMKRRVLAGSLIGVSPRPRKCLISVPNTISAAISRCWTSAISTRRTSA